MISDRLSLPRLLTDQRDSQRQQACPWLETVLRVPRAGNLTGNAGLKALLFNIPKPHPFQPARPHILLRFSIVGFLWREFLFPFSIKLLLILQEVFQMASPYLLVKSFPGSPMERQNALPCSVHITFVFWLKGELETEKPEQTFLFSH